MPTTTTETPSQQLTPLQIAGRIGAQGLLSKTPNQRALSAVHQGLQNVPGGSVFESFFESATGRNVTGTGSGLTGAQSSQLMQTSEDTAAIRANTGMVDFGSLKTEVDEILAGVGGADRTGYEVAIRDGVVSALNTLWKYGANVANIGADRGLFRNDYAVNFLTVYGLVDGQYYAFPQDNLNAAWPGANLPGENDVTMLNRVLPAHTWVDNYNGTHLPGAAVSAGVGGWTYDAYYLPPAPSLSQIKALWDYTPSSGPPMRNGIEDSMRMWALLPVQY